MSSGGMSVSRSGTSLSKKCDVSNSRTEGSMSSSASCVEGRRGSGSDEACVGESEDGRGVGLGDFVYHSNTREGGAGRDCCSSASIDSPGRPGGSNGDPTEMLSLASAVTLGDEELTSMWSASWEPWGDDEKKCWPSQSVFSRSVKSGEVGLSSTVNVVVPLS